MATISMEKKLIRILVIVVTLLILFFPNYYRCSNLAEANLFSTYLTFEDPDQDDQFADQPNEPNAFLLNAFPIICLPGINLSKQLLRFSFQTASLRQKTFPLRC